MKLPNGYGSVVKLSGNRRKPWIVKKTIGWSEDNSQIRQIIGYYETRQEGLQALAIFNENPYTIEAKQITVEQLFEKWKKDKYPKIAYKTQQVYNMCWNYCIKEIPNDIKGLQPISISKLPFVDIKTIHLQSVVDTMGNKWSAKKAFKILWHQLYDYAMKFDLCHKKYSTYIDIGKKTTKLKRVPFTESEKQNFWDNIDRMDFIDTILILIYTGVRIGELLDIKLENVHLDKRYMVGGSKTEAGKDRIIPIHKRILPLVEKWYNNALKVNCEYLIFNHENNQMRYWNFYEEKWKKIIEQLEMDSTHKPHDTRHTFATDMDNKRANKLCIKRIMGHASKDVTDKVYTHKDIEELIQAVDLLD